MGKRISGGFVKLAADAPFQGSFVTGANLRRSSKPTSPEAAPAPKKAAASKPTSNKEE